MVEKESWRQVILSRLPIILILLIIFIGVFVLDFKPNILNTPECPEMPYKWIDEDNLVVVYMVPSDCELQVLPLQWTMPDTHGQTLLEEYMRVTGQKPPANSLPKDWKRVVVPIPSFN